MIMQLISIKSELVVFIMLKKYLNRLLDNFVLVLFLLFFSTAALSVFVSFVMPETSRYLSFQKAIKIPVNKIIEIELSTLKDYEDDSKSYEVLTKFEFTYQNKIYTSTHASIYQGKDNFGSFQQNLYKKILDYHKNGGELYCYVLPDKPEQAVIDRSFRISRGLAPILLLLAFTIVCIILFISIFYDSKAKVYKPKVNVIQQYLSSDNNSFKLEIESSGSPYIVEQNQDALTISRKWNSGLKGLGFLCFALFYMTFWGIIYSVWEQSLQNPLDFFVPGFFFFIGLFLTYLALGILFNTTTLIFSNKELELKHSPIPWAGNCHIKTSKIIEIFVKEKFNKDVDNSKNDHFSFQVRVKLLKDITHTLFQGINSRHTAKLLEQMLNQFLKHVKGA